MNYKELINQYISDVKEQYGFYLESCHGFHLNVKFMQDLQKKSKALTGISIDKLDKRVFIFGDGHPEKGKEIHRITQEQFKKNNSRLNHQIALKNFIRYIFDNLGVLNQIKRTKEIPIIFKYLEPLRNRLTHPYNKQPVPEYKSEFSSNTLPSFTKNQKIEISKDNLENIIHELQNSLTKDYYIFLIENNLRDKLIYFPSKIKSMQITTIDNISLINSKLSSDTFNAICGGKITKKLAQQVVNYYNKINSLMSWWIGPSSQKKDADEILKSAGLVHDEMDVGMFCDLSQSPNNNLMPETLKIKNCETPKDFIDFGEAASTCFNSPDNMNVKKFYKQVGLLNKEDFSNSVSYVGYENDQPVATAFLLLTDVAGIYDITTHPQKRNKGYGSAMFYTVLAEAKKRGSTIAVLEASPSGLNIYKRFGFEEICKFNVWSNKGIIKQ